MSELKLHLTDVKQMSIERMDVGYVGVIDDYFIPIMTFDDPRYYIPILGNLGFSNYQPSFSRAAVGDMLSNVNTSYQQAYFRALPSSEVENGWTFTIADSNGTFKGYLQFVMTDDVPDGRSGSERLVCTISSYSPTVIIVTPQEPSGYGGGMLLAGIRYKLSMPDGRILNVPITNEQQASGALAGLYRGATRIEEVRAIHNANIIFVPVHPAQYLERTPPDMGKLTATVGITQCIDMSGTGYGDSNYCNTWPSSRGFSTEDDIQDVIYFYSQDGSCGQSYVANGVEVLTSIGEDCDDNQACTFHNDEFSCVRDGILHQQWFWIIVAILILIMVVVILAAVVLK